MKTDNLISPFYEVLIFLEDKGRISVKKIKSWGKTSSRGIIGKLKALKLIYPEVIDGEEYFKLSDEGYVFLNNILDVLHKRTEHWDGKWRLLIFSVPEKERKRRDKFRRLIEAMGLKLLANGLWLTPLDLKNEIIETANLMNFKNNILLIECSQNNIFGLKTEDILKCWDFNASRKSFENFYKKSSEIFSSNSRKDNLKLKKVIFEYALILKKEPRLPIELFPKDWPKYRANFIYQKIRRSIV